MCERGREMIWVFLSDYYEYYCRVHVSPIQVNLGKYSLNISISIGIIFYNKDNLTKTLEIYQTSMHY